jgi:magnesium transporter
MIQSFFENDMTTAVHSLESMDETGAVQVLEALPPSLAARIVKYLQISFAAALLKDADEQFLKELATLLDPQLAASILMHLPFGDRERMASLISNKLQGKIRELLEYPESSVGRIMSMDFLGFDKDITAQNAIDEIRSMAKKRFPLSYIYVVDSQRHLIGVLNMRDLMLAPPEKLLEAISRKDIFAIHCFTDQQEAAAELGKRKYFAAPVVDGENRIIGMIKAERMLQGVQDDITQDIQKMFGVSGDERTFSSIFFSLRKRLTWLNINLITAFLAAAVVALFEGVIAKITVLAVFLPVVAGQGGNAGAQSLAVVMRGLVMREVPSHKVFKLITKEALLGAINGILIGSITGLVALLWYSNPYLGIVVGLGMLVNLICAGLAGASIPLLMKKIGIDPAQSSNIILTTVTDIVGFFAFLGFAVLFQNHLI